MPDSVAPKPEIIDLWIDLIRCDIGDVPHFRPTRDIGQGAAPPYRILYGDSWSLGTYANLSDPIRP